MANNNFSKFQTYLIPLVSIILVIFLVPAVILPQFKKIKENYLVVSQNKDRLATLEIKAEALKKLASAQESLDKNLAIAESALPIEKDVARLVRGVQNLATTNGLEVSKVEIKPGKTATVAANPTGGTTANSTNQTSAPVTAAVSKSELLFELNMKGNIGSFQSFLKSIEGTKRLLLLSSFKSTSETGDSYNFTVVISAPFGPLPQLSQDQLASAISELSANNQKLLQDLESTVFKDVTNEPLPSGPTGTADPFR